MVFIEINKISKTFFPNTNRSHHALKDISLNIEAGDFITIIGGNGAGKSTLLNAVSGTFSLDSGTILINEEDITNSEEYERAKYISRVFQNPLDGTAPRMMVAENMSLALRRGKKRTLSIGTKKEELENFKKLLLTLNLGVEEKLNTEVGVLSGGQRQAISLIMATMLEPKLILLDEHTAALDPKTQKIIMKITNEKIAEKKLTALMITHNLHDALNYGNRMIVMHQGEIVRDFSKSEKEKLTIDDIYKLLLSLDEN